MIGSKSLAALLAAGALFAEAAAAAPAIAPRDEGPIPSAGILHLGVDETIAPDPDADALTLRLLLDRIGCRLAPDAFAALVNRLALLPEQPGAHPLAELSGGQCAAPSDAGGIGDTNF